MKECTFKPKINNKYQRDNVYRMDHSADRFDLLYKLGTQSIIQKKNKTNEDFEFEKYGEECTFKPVLSEYNSTVLKRNENFMDKDIERFNERMKKGRIVNFYFLIIKLI